MILMNLPSSIDSDHRALIGHLSEKLDQKRRRGLLRETYYNQKRVLRQVTPIVPPQYYKLGLVLGWASKPVDLLANRCNLDQMTSPDETVTDQIRTVWDDNQLDIEIASAETACLIHGVSFLVNVVGEPGEPASQIHALDALSATGDWNTRTRRLDNLLSVRERREGRITDFSLYLPDLTINAYLEHGVWQVDQHVNEWHELLVEPMVYRPRTGRMLGHSRITRTTMALCDAAIRSLIRMEGHLDIYSYPELWLLGADMTIFRNDDGSRKDVMQIRMDRMLGIPDDEDAENPRADVKQFPASNPTPHLAGLNAYAKLLARETQLPDSSFAITDVSNPTSAEAYDASQYELIALADKTTRMWSRPIRRTVQRAVAIQRGEKTVADDLQTIDCEWRNPRFLSRSAEADAGMKQLAAVPWLAETTVGLKLLGLTTQQIDAALAERRRAQGRELLSQIGVAETTTLPADQNAPVPPVPVEG